MLPQAVPGPLRSVLRRMAYALALIAVCALIVWIERSGYKDSSGRAVSLLTAFYYATVTLSTTGYGDVVPVTDGARLANILLITPLRVMFLLLLVGTTLEVLTERTRSEWRRDRWRSHVRDHTVVVGYGTMGRSAVQTLLGNGVPADQIVIVDSDPDVIAEANRRGLVGVVGDGGRTEVLERAGVGTAKHVIIAARRDDAAVLTTLTVRQLNRRAVVIASAREAENAPLLRESGATTVITSADAAGQLLGVAMLSPRVGAVVQDLLSYGSGLEIVERPAENTDIGLTPHACRQPVLAVIRGSRTMRYDDPAVETVKSSDRLVVVRSVGK